MPNRLKLESCVPFNLFLTFSLIGFKKKKVMQTCRIPDFIPDVIH